MQFGDFFFDGDKRVAYEAPIGFSFTLDGNGYRIYTPDDLPSAPLTTQYDVKSEVWSKYVDYMDAIEWATKMMVSSGGALRPDGSNATADFSIINGWKIVPANYKHALILIGNISADVGHPIMDVFDTDRLSVILVPMIQSADSLITYTITSGSGLSTEEHEKLLSVPTSDENSTAVWTYTRP